MCRMKIVIGDWSGDGHMRTAEFTLESSMSVEDTQAAYKAAKEIVPSHLHPSNICSEYGQYSVDSKFFNEIVEYYFKDNEDWNLVEEDDDEVWMDTGWLAEITVAFVRKGNPEIKVELVDDYLTLLTLDQIGYGLFE